MIKRLLLLSALITCTLNGFSQVLINEFSAANYENVIDNFGSNKVDWIELYNNSSTSVDLGGYYLSDDEDDLAKFQFPAGTTISANGFLRVWASGRDDVTGSNIHTNFQINQTAEEWVILSDPTLVILDAFEIEVANQTNHSWARTQDGGPTWAVASGPTPNSSNGATFTGYTNRPELSPLAGFYNGPTEITVNSLDQNVNIYYTTDGSEPSQFSTQYTGPFTVSATTVVKTIAISNDNSFLKSHTEYHTYFINEDHSLPVVSIAGESLNTLMGGTQNEPIGSFELFNENGNRVADATGEFNKHGNDSWAYPQRGIDYISRDQFGDDYALKYGIFDEEITERDEFQRVILKAAANDNYPFETGGAHIRDAYVHTLSQQAGMEMDARTSRSCVMYVNGEYWGVYDIREKVDDHDYTKYYYNQDKNEIDFIKTWGGTWAEYGQTNEWDDLVDFVLANDMTDATNYAYVEGELNVLSLIDYMILHSHIVSLDWLNWNTAWWRGYNPNGGALKWRYILWDEDATFGHYVNYTGVPDTGPLADPCNPELLNDPGGQGHIPVLNALLENEDFFALYINRYADLNNQYFNCDFMIPLLNEMIGAIEPEMQRQIDRWGGTMTEWQANVQALRDFIEDRCVVINNAIVDCYEDEGLSGPYNVTILVEPDGGGFVQANTTVGLNYPWNTNYFGGIDLTFTNVPEEDWLFSHWEVLNNDYTPDQFAETIGMTVNEGDTIIAHFIPGPCLGIWVDPGLEEDMIVCEGSTLELEASAGPGYTYEWSTGATTQSITVDDNGDYGVTVYDANGCDGYVEVDVDEEDSLEPIIIGNTTICTGFETTLDAGDGYDDYQWSTGSDEQIIDVTAGTYEVIVSATGGCTGIAEIIVEEVDGLPIEIAGNLEICEGTLTNLSATGGYDEYEWSDGSDDETLTVNSSGTYSVTVTDDDGCSGESQVIVEAGTVATSSANESICYGGTYDGVVYTQSTTLQSTMTGVNGCDSIHSLNLNVASEITVAFNSESDCTTGGATLSASPAGGSGNYSYQWSTGSSDQVLTELPQGTYEVTITDVNGCTNTSSTFVDPAEGITLDFDVDPVSCFGESSGEIDLTVLTAEEPYTITWSNGMNDEDLDDLQAGTYNIIVTDANGCNYGTSVQVGQPNPLGGVITTTPATGPLENNGALLVTPSGGTPPFTYLWQNIGYQTPVVLDIEPGEYTVVITDANGCEFEVSVELGFSSSVSSIEGLLEFNIHPNPSTGSFFVRLGFEQVKEVALEIYDITGKQIRSLAPQSGQEMNIPVDITDVADGTYLLVANVDGKRVSKKIVIAK
ncbi:MAG: CotH kinase family protein [Saprospiraceae bacterium]